MFQRHPLRSHVRSRWHRLRRPTAVVAVGALGLSMFSVIAAAPAYGAASNRTWTFNSTAEGAQWVADQKRGRLEQVTGGTGGSLALRITNSENVNRTLAITDVANQAGAVKGEIYRITAKVKTNSPNLSSGLMVREVLNGTYPAANRKEVGAWLTGTNWQTVTLDYPVGLTGSVIDINVMAWDTKPGQNLWVDDVQFQRVTSTTTTPAPAPVPPAPTPPATSCGAQGKLAPACGALWGIYTLQGADASKSVTDLEARVGRPFDLTLRYHDFSDTYPGRFPDSHEQLLGQSRILFLSWQARVSSTNQSLRWSDIARGAYDQQFVLTAAQRVKAYGKQMIIAFDPEFDSGPNTRGTPEEYVAAYRHIHDIFRQQGVTNVVWAWVSTGYTGAGNDQKILRGYPGDQYVDWVGYDPYNFYRCNNSGWKTFETTIAGGYNWLISQGFGDKPFILSEYGTQFDSANAARSVEWNKSIPQVLPKYPNIKGLIRFDANGVFGSTGCNMYVNNGAGMLDSFAEAGRSSYLRTRG